MSGALAAAVLVAAGGAVFAHAAGSKTSPAKATGGGLALTNASIQHRATAGQADTVTVANNSKQPLTITVAARPWVQSSTGRVVPNRRATLSGVSVSDGSFTLAPGDHKDVTVTLNSVPRVGFLYGGLEVIGVPPTASKKGIVTGYRLISALRYAPPTATYGLKVGAAKVVARGKSGTFAVTVKSTGNTVVPVSGTLRLKGPLGTRQGSVDSAKVLPGKSIQLGLLASKPPAGTYTATITLKQGSYRTNVTKKVVVKK